MIATVTLNPSLDYIANVKNFKIGALNRTTHELILPGGKGTNVSIVLKNLEIDTMAFGFCGGFSGHEFERLLTLNSVSSSFIYVKDGNTRINVKIHGDCETELNGKGPKISVKELEELFTKLDKLNSDDILVLAGSIPSSLPNTIYSDIMDRLTKKNIKIVVDTTKTLLLNVLDKEPFLIKPNKVELGELFNVEIKSEKEVIKYAKKLRKLGAQNVLVSLGKDGAILVDKNDQIHISKAVGGKVVNSVGAGDSMVAGFLAGYLKNNNYKDAFKFSICAGGASAVSHFLATKEEIYNLLDEIK